MWFGLLIQCILLEVTKGHWVALPRQTLRFCEIYSALGIEAFLRMCFSLAFLELMLIKAAPTSYFSI